MARRIYLDYNCFQRGFDDPRQVRIRMEAAACEKILEDAEAGRVELVWSFMHVDENDLCPYPERREEVARLAGVCAVRVGPTEAIRALAGRIQASGLSAKDALHLAAAVHAQAVTFVTCDDEIVRKAARLPIEIPVINPIQYVLG